MTEQLKDFIRSHPYLSLNRISVDLWGPGNRSAVQHFVTGYQNLTPKKQNQLASVLSSYGFEPPMPLQE